MTVLRSVFVALLGVALVATACDDDGDDSAEPLPWLEDLSYLRCEPGDESARCSFRLQTPTGPLSTELANEWVINRFGSSFEGADVTFRSAVRSVSTEAFDGCIGEAATYCMLQLPAAVQTRLGCLPDSPASLFAALSRSNTLTNLIDGYGVATDDQPNLAIERRLLCDLLNEVRGGVSDDSQSRIDEAIERTVEERTAWLRELIEQPQYERVWRNLPETELEEVGEGLRLWRSSASVGAATQGVDVDDLAIRQARVLLRALF